MTHNDAFRSIVSWYSSRSSGPRGSREAWVTLLTYIPLSTLAVVQINWQAQKKKDKKNKKKLGGGGGGSLTHNNAVLSNWPWDPNLTIITLTAKMHIQ